MPLPDPRLEYLLNGGTPKLEPLLRWLLEASPKAPPTGEARRTRAVCRSARPSSRIAPTTPARTTADVSIGANSLNIPRIQRDES